MAALHLLLKKKEHCVQETGDSIRWLSYFIHPLHAPFRWLNENYSLIWTKVVTAQAYMKGTALQPWFQYVSLPLTLKGSDAGRAALFSLRQQYLLITKSLRALDLALPVVLHDHHGSIDFPHCQVCCCWENDKLPCKIRPFGMDPEREEW